MDTLGTATYSPDDNKLRLYPFARLSAEDYAKVKAAGFSWAPKQELFVAPMWTPSREDLLIELCGEIDDEDTTLADRAEERAERFDNYSEKRAEESDQAAKIAHDMAYQMNGQPILVGHHSEKRHRKQIARMQDLTGKSVQLWRTSQYWQDRAAGAIRHAAHHERPDVRARRIKTIEADRRKVEKNKTQTEKLIAVWSSDKLDMAMALHIANHYDHISKCFTLADYPRNPPASQYEGSMSLWSALTDGIINHEQAREIALRVHRRYLPIATRWLEHYDNRLAYERAMLTASGGTVADRTGPEVGGACQCWASPGRYNGGWSYIQKVNKVSVTVLDNWGNGGRNFTRTIPFDKLHGVMTRAQVEEARNAGRVNEIEGRGFTLAAEIKAA